MSLLQLSPANTDLLRRLDQNQDGIITTADVREGEDCGLLPAPEFTPGAARRLERLGKRSQGKLRLALGRRRLYGPEDWRWAAKRLKNRMAAHHGLPALVLRTDRVRVIHGDDPGNYYCEHLFYTLQALAAEYDSPVLHDAHGQSLIGFLHIPTDRYCWNAARIAADTDRHAATRQVVAAALRGLVETLMARYGANPLHVLITGFDAFRRIQSNPTGDFVSRGADIDAAITLAFPESQGHESDGEALIGFAAIRRHYTLTHGQQTRLVTLSGIRLPVDDRALDAKSTHSIHRAVQDLQPHAILAMGVASHLAPGTFIVESHADDHNLHEGRHSRGRPPTHSQPATYALARAIHLGAACLNRP